MGEEKKVQMKIRGMLSELLRTRNLKCYFNTERVIILLCYIIGPLVGGKSVHISSLYVDL